MLLSYVVPTRNRPKEVIRLLHSLKTQNIEDCELVVVDDSDTEDTKKLVLKLWPRAKIVSGGKKGPGEARNAGIKNSSGDYILFVDDDVVLKTNCVNNMLKHYADVVYPTIVFGTGELMYPVRDYEFNMLYVTTVFLIKREALSKMDSFFDPTYVLNYEDADFFIRAKKLGLKMKYAPSARSIHLEEKNKEDWQKRYFYELRNLPYAAIKLKYALRRSKLRSDFNKATFVKKLACGILNYNPAHYSSVKGKRSTVYKVKDMFFDRNRRLSNNIFTSNFLTFKALVAGITLIPAAFRERKKLKLFIKEANI